MKKWIFVTLNSKSAAMIFFLSMYMYPSCFFKQTDFFMYAMGKNFVEQMHWECDAYLHKISIWWICYMIKCIGNSCVFLPKVHFLLPPSSLLPPPSSHQTSSQNQQESETSKEARMYLIEMFWDLLHIILKDLIAEYWMISH